MLGGRLSATLPAGRLEYRRRFRLPNGMVLALGAGAQHEGGSNGRSGGGSGDSSGGGRRRRHRFRPFLGCQLQLAAGGADGGELAGGCCASDVWAAAVCASLCTPGGAEGGEPCRALLSRSAQQGRGARSVALLASERPAIPPMLPMLQVAVRRWW